MFTCKLQPSVTFGTPSIGFASMTFTKLPSLAEKEITERIIRGVKIRRGKRLIAYTSNTINVLRAIIKRLDRVRNIAKISFEELKQLTGIRNRSTLADHLYLLESDVQFIDVKRGRSKGVKNTINIYRLVGIVADCVLDRKRAKTAKKADLQSPIIGQESESMFGCLLDKVSQQTKDFGIANRILLKLIEDYGHDRVDAVVAYVLKQTWNPTNPQGLAVNLVRDPKFDPAKQTQKPSIKAIDPVSKFEDMDLNVPLTPTNTDVPSQDMPDLPWLAETQQQSQAPAGIQDASWEFAHKQLQLQLDRQTFDLWLKSSILVGVEDNHYMVWCETSRARDMCQQMLYRNIRRVLSDVIGVSAEEVVIKFVTAEDMAVA
jgi:hypothetical protein